MGPKNTRSASGAPGRFTEAIPRVQCDTDADPIDTGACLPLAVTFGKAQPHSRMVVGCTDKTVRLMGTGGNTIATATGHTDWVYAVAASPDGLHLASASADGTVKIWGPAGKLLLHARRRDTRAMKRWLPLLLVAGDRGRRRPQDRAGATRAGLDLSGRRAARHHHRSHRVRHQHRAGDRTRHRRRRDRQTDRWQPRPTK